VIRPVIFLWSSLGHQTGGAAFRASMIFETAMILSQSPIDAVADSMN